MKDDFFNEIEIISKERYLTVKKITDIIESLNNELESKVMYGGLVYKKGTKLYFGIFNRKEHITIEISRGVDLEDSENLLEGVGNKEGRKHLKIFSFKDIEDKQVKRFLTEANILLEK